jgi:hypothetical protein
MDKWVIVWLQHVLSTYAIVAHLHPFGFVVPTEPKCECIPCSMSPKSISQLMPDKFSNWKACRIRVILTAKNSTGCCNVFLQSLKKSAQVDAAS